METGCYRYVLYFANVWYYVDLESTMQTFILISRECTELYAPLVVEDHNDSGSEEDRSDAQSIAE